MTSRFPAALTALAAFLIAAFVVAPGPLAGSLPGGLGATVHQAFDDYWRSGQWDRIQPVVDYWFRYHLAKGAIAALLLAVLIALAVRLWRRGPGRAMGGGSGGAASGGSGRVASGGSRRVAGGGSRRAVGAGLGRALAGVGVGLLGVVALAAVMANVQGAIAPFASLLPMLQDGTLAQVAPELTAGAHPPAAVAVMVDDFARYHVAMAVIATVLAVTFAVGAVLAGRRFLRADPADRGSRLATGSIGAVAAVLSVVMIVLAVANTSVAADPEPAFLAFVNGGW